MADDRIDIELVDKVSPQIANKIERIAEASRVAHTKLIELRKSINSLDKLSQSETKAALAADKLSISSAKAAIQQQKLAYAQSQANSAANRAALSELRLKNARDKATFSTKSSSSMLSVLKANFLGVAAAVGSLWAVLSKADEFANLENRLRSTGLEGQNLTDTMQKLEDVANSTRSGLRGSVELYSRLAVSSKELGVSQDDLLGFTKSLNQAILLSGASAEEAQAGLIQLSQGMASGRLQGDELRSVLEQLPAVADVIAKSMGVTRGKLRQLGSEGKISAQAVLKAFKEAGPELGEKFAKQATTAGQALTVLNNKALALAGTEGKGSLAQVVGLLTDLSTSLNDAKGEIKFLASSLEFLLKTVRTLYVVFSSVLLNIPTILKALTGNALIAFGTISSAAISITKDLTSILPDKLTKGMRNNFDELKKASEKYIADGNKLREDAEKNDATTWAKIKEIWSTKTIPDETTDTTTDTTTTTTGTKNGAGDLRFNTFSNSDIVAAFENVRKLKRELVLSPREAEFFEISKQLREAGYSDKDISRLREATELYWQQADAAKALAEVTERRKQILDSIKKTDFATAMSDLVALGLDKTQRQDYLISQNANLFEGTQEAIDANLRSYEEMYSRIDAMRQANDISETTASQMRTKLWVMENETRYSNASQTLGNLAVLQESTNRHISAVGKAAASSQATIDGILAVQKALASAPPPANIALAASVGVMTAANVAKINNLPGFETGGYTGNVGTSDVAGLVHGREFVFDAAATQRIGVDNLEAMRSGESSPQNAAAGKSVRIVNVIDPALVSQFLNSSDGEEVILNTIRNNSETLKMAMA